MCQNSSDSNMEFERKTRRFSHTLYRHLGIRPQDQPTQYLVLCNAGFSTGLREKDIVMVFQEFGTIDQILLLPEKSFSIVTFGEVSSALTAYEKLNGTVKLTQHGQPLYLTYVPSLPCIKNHENSSVPDGLHLIEDFINSEEEKILMSSINWNTSNTDLKNRKVKHYGYEFLYNSNNIDIKNPLEEKIPSQCDFIWERLKTNHNILTNGLPNQLTVNQYEPGQGIPLHVDTHSAFHSPLISLSLGSTVIMEFKRPTTESSFDYYKVPLPARSILIMNDSSRYEWSHGIVPRTYDVINGKIQERTQRTSFTFRWIRLDGKCDCKFNSQCDTFINEQKSETDLENFASLIEKQHVHQVYQNIASHFDNTRSKIWPCVSEFVNNLSAGSFLIDIGCGNGKNLHIRQDIFQIGIEYSNALANIAAWKSWKNDSCENETNNNTSPVQIVQGDCLNVPLSSNCADAVISIAVFHHLVTEERRKIAIRESVRLLKPEGVALITVWARDQHRGNVKTSYLKQDRKNRKPPKDTELKSSMNSSFETLHNESGESLNVSLPVHRNRTDFLHQDMLVPWKLKQSNENTNDSENNDFMRFYHVFEENELENLCISIGGIIIERSFYEQGNWCVILKKI